MRTLSTDDFVQLGFGDRVIDEAPLIGLELDLTELRNLLYESARTQNELRTRDQFDATVADFLKGLQRKGGETTTVIIAMMPGAAA